MSDKILSGIRVLDFGRFIAGPLCGAMLADLGAEVIRIERAEGNEDRYLMPVNEAGEGAMFLQMNRNKRSLGIDVTRPDKRDILVSLIKSADVVIVNLPPAALKKVGLDYESLSAIRPDIILTTVTAYGSRGAFADNIGFDGSGQALSGAIHLTGTPEHPYRSATSYVDYSTGLSAAYGTLAAIISRMKTGKGQQVEASLLGTALMMTNPMLIEESTGARSRVAVGNRSPISGPSDVFQTIDGWILVQVVGNVIFKRWALTVGAEELIDDPRFSTDILRGDNGEALSAHMGPWCAKRTTEECLAILKENRVPAYRVLNPKEALHAPENTVFFAPTKVEGLAEPVPVVLPVARLSGHPVEAFQPAPALGAHTEEILASVGWSATEIAAVTAVSATALSS